MLWRNFDNGRGVLLRITRAGLDALGGEPTAPLWGPWRRGRGGTAAGGARKAPTAAGISRTRGDPKQALLVEILRRAEAPRHGVGRRV